MVDYIQHYLKLVYLTAVAYFKTVSTHWSSETAVSHDKLTRLFRHPYSNHRRFIPSSPSARMYVTGQNKALILKCN